MQSKNSFTSQKQNNYLQPKHQLLITGTISHTEVHPREVVKRALYFNAAAVISDLNQALFNHLN